MPKKQNIWLTPKENFIKKFEAYFDKKFDDFTKQRISRILDEYSEDTEIVIKKKNKNDDDDDIKYLK